MNLPILPLSFCGNVLSGRSLTWLFVGVLLMNSCGTAVLAMTPPAAPEVRPVISGTYPADADGDRIADSLQSHDAKSGRRLSALSSDGEKVSVELVFSEPVTQAQIDANQVVYVHNGSNTTSDSITFTVDDGQGNSLGSQNFGITVTAVDDDAPAPFNNNGATVLEGNSVAITKGTLRYDDSEQPAGNVTYTIQRRRQQRERR